MDDRKLVEDAVAAGVNLAPLSLYYMNEPRYRGFLMGYAGVAEPEMDAAIAVLRDVMLRAERLSA